MARSPQLGKQSAALGTGLGLLPVGRETGGAATRGEITFPLPGTYEWLIPAGVTSISMVGIAGGGGASTDSANTYKNASGGGGGLAYTNNVSAKEGDVVDVIVGAGGKSAYFANGTDGGFTKISVNGVLVCHASGGGAGLGLTPSFGVGGTNIVGDGGGTGGDGVSIDETGQCGCTGGGGPGYSGTGGKGIYDDTADKDGNDGTGGGGASGGFYINNCCQGSSGTGLFGEGDNGVGGTGLGVPPTGGSGGEDVLPNANVSVQNSVTTPSTKNGAGGSSFMSGSSGFSVPMPGASGGVRIVWGAGREFPSTDVGIT